MDAIVALALIFLLAWVPAWVICEKPGRGRMVLAYVLGAGLSLAALIGYALSFGSEAHVVLNRLILAPFAFPLGAIWITRSTSKPKQVKPAPSLPEGRQLATFRSQLDKLEAEVQSLRDARPDAARGPWSR